MSRYLTPRQFARIAALGFIVLIAAVAMIRSQADLDAAIVAPLRREQADALASELARCRMVTPDQAASLESCRRVWTENRRQFFGPTKTRPASAEPIPSAATGAEKIGDRFSPVETERQQSEAR